MLTVTLKVECDGTRSEVRRTAPGALSWEGQGLVRDRLPNLLLEIHGPDAARHIAEGLRRRSGLHFLRSFRPVGYRGRTGSFPADFTMFAVVDELTFGIEDAPTLFTPNADFAERLRRAGVDGRDVLRAVADRLNAGVAGRRRTAPGFDLGTALSAVGSEGPWQVAMRRDRRPMAASEWGPVETDAAEVYDRAGRPVAALWRQCRREDCRDATALAAFEDFVWRVAASAGPGAARPEGGPSAPARGAVH